MNQESGPRARYAADVQERGYVPDAAQAAAVEALQGVYDELMVRYQRGRRLFRPRDRTPFMGLYLWGGVGRGKTYLMDLFFDALPFRRKMRVHFHRFMQRVHHDLKVLQGTPDPLKRVADQLAREAVVICFDEFFVTDIADAMILGGLFEALFARGVTLVATSNIIPDRLYENGLQRQRFLPAIALVKQRCTVLNVDAGIDYRLRVLVQAELYHAPLDEAAEQSLQRSYEALSQGQAPRVEPLIINDRPIAVVARTDGLLWCQFSVLCEQPRSASDFIELAREFHTVLISGVPPLGAANDDAARRFIYLVDEFYDRKVKLVLTAAVPLFSLYGEGRLTFEFQRTLSRLQEMQSKDYLAEAHAP